MDRAPECWGNFSGERWKPWRFRFGPLWGHPQLVFPLSFCYVGPVHNGQRYKGASDVLEPNVFVLGPVTRVLLFALGRGYAPCPRMQVLLGPRWDLSALREGYRQGIQDLSFQDRPLVLTRALHPGAKVPMFRHQS